MANLQQQAADYASQQKAWSSQTYGWNGEMEAAQNIPAAFNPQMMGPPPPPPSEGAPSQNSASSQQQPWPAAPGYANWNAYAAWPGQYGYAQPAATNPWGYYYGSAGPPPPPPPSAQNTQDLPTPPADDEQTPSFDESKDEDLIEFDKQFRTWEDKYDTWKEENKDHPDKESLATYESTWKKWREDLLEKREELKKTKIASAPVTPAANPTPDLPTEPVNIPGNDYQTPYQGNSGYGYPQYLSQRPPHFSGPSGVRPPMAASQPPPVPMRGNGNMIGDPRPFPPRGQPPPSVPLMDYTNKPPHTGDEYNNQSWQGTNEPPPVFNSKSYTADGIPGLDIPQADDKPSISTPSEEVKTDTKAEDKNAPEVVEANTFNRNIGPIGLHLNDSVDPSISKGWKPPEDWYEDDEDNENQRLHGNKRHSSELSNLQTPPNKVLCNKPYPSDPNTFNQMSYDRMQRPDPYRMPQHPSYGEPLPSGRRSGDVSTNTRDPSQVDLFDRPGPEGDMLGRGRPSLVDRIGRNDSPEGDTFGRGRLPEGDRFGRGRSSEMFGRGHPGGMLGRGHPGNMIVRGVSEIDRIGRGGLSPGERFGRGGPSPGDRFARGGPSPAERFGSRPEDSASRGKSEGDMFVREVLETDRFGRGPVGDRFGRGAPQGNVIGRGGPQHGGIIDRGGPSEGDRFGRGGPPGDRFGRGLPGDRFGRGGPPGDQFGRGVPPGDRFGQGGPPGDRLGRGCPPGDRFDRAGPPGDRLGRGGPPGDRLGRGGPLERDRFGLGSPKGDRVGPPDGGKVGTVGPLDGGGVGRGGPLESDRLGRGGPPGDRFGRGGPPGDRFGLGGPPGDRFDRGGLAGDRFGREGPPEGDRFDRGGPAEGDRFGRGGPPEGDRFGRAGPTVGDRFGRGGPPEGDRFGRGGPPGDKFGRGGPPGDRFGRGGLPEGDRFGRGGPPEGDRFGLGGPPEGDRFGRGGLPEGNRFGRGRPLEVGRGGPLESDRFGRGGPPDGDRFGRGRSLEGDRFGHGGPPEGGRFGRGGPPKGCRFGRGPPLEGDRFGRGGPPDGDRFGRGGPPDGDRFGRGGPPDDDRFGRGAPLDSEIIGRGGTTADRLGRGEPSEGDKFGRGGPQEGNRFGRGGPPEGDKFDRGGPPEGDKFGRGGPTDNRFGRGGLSEANRFGRGGARDDQFRRGPLGDRFDKELSGERFGSEQSGGDFEKARTEADRFGTIGQPEHDRFGRGDPTESGRFVMGAGPPEDKFGRSGPSGDKFERDTSLAGKKLSVGDMAGKGSPLEVGILGKNPIGDRLGREGLPSEDKFRIGSLSLGGRHGGGVALAEDGLGRTSPRDGFGGGSQDTYGRGGHLYGRKFDDKFGMAAAIDMYEPKSGRFDMERSDSSISVRPEQRDRFGSNQRGLNEDRLGRPSFELDRFARPISLREGMHSDGDRFSKPGSGVPGSDIFSRPNSSEESYGRPYGRGMLPDKPRVTNEASFERLDRVPDGHLRKPGLLDTPTPGRNKSFQSSARTGHPSQGLNHYSISTPTDNIEGNVDNRSVMNNWFGRIDRASTKDDNFDQQDSYRDDQFHSKPLHRQGNPQSLMDMNLPKVDNTSNQVRGREQEVRKDLQTEFATRLDGKNSGNDYNSTLDQRYRPRGANEFSQSTNKNSKVPPSDTFRNQVKGEHGTHTHKQEKNKVNLQKLAEAETGFKPELSGPNGVDIVPIPKAMAPEAGEKVSIDDIISVPGRFMRPPKLVIILRGLPGSGKTTMAKMIKNREIENGGSAPRILCLDDYFMVEVEKMTKDKETGRTVKTKAMEYEYEPELEDQYRAALVKSFKKQVDEKFFPFIIVDCVHSHCRNFMEICDYAQNNDFEPYIAELDVDVQTCVQRNAHGRQRIDIQRLSLQWELSPAHITQLDLTSYMQDADIQDVEMEDCMIEENDQEVDEEKEIEEVKDDKEKLSEDDETTETFTIIKQLMKSKWDAPESQEATMDKLDGVRTAKKKMGEIKPQSIEDWLQLSKEFDDRDKLPGKKRVRWADIEERKKQENARQRGFVLGQTDWQRMTDPSMGSSALVQVKYI